ncbi:MAG: outer membrane lipoprotein carrier protein LolA [Holosporaceae bacterium]|jgi:outer membrane lipoprotein-sorting protein|nr:outer membrane lipoprotein carrier protein LolA [Holosporaceae bacterium]
MKFLVAGILSLFLDLEASGVDRKADDPVGETEKYLNSVTTFEADFVQTDRYGEKSFGHFFLKRPFLMKMDYRNPPTRVVIAKDNKIIHYDRELKEKTETSMYSSPLSFLLEKKINLRKNLKVLSVTDEADFLSIKFCRKNEEDEGAVTLVFSKNPLTLIKWTVFSDSDDESFSGRVEISLLNPKSGHDIPAEEFKRFRSSEGAER